MLGVMGALTAGMWVGIRTTSKQEVSRADFYIEWAAHLNPEKTYVISSAEWENLFSLTPRYGFIS